MKIPNRTWTASAAGALWLAAAGTAGTRIYHGEYRFNDPRLYAIAPGGAEVDPLDVIPAEDWLVVGLHVDAANGKIYWTHGSSGSGRIRRANLDGSGMETLLSGLRSARGLAVDVAGGKLYWSDTQDRVMERANLDGTGREVIVDTGDQLGRPTLDLDDGRIYFGNYGAGDVRRANLDGSGQEVLFDGLFTPVAVALDIEAGKIYWADANTIAVSNHIARANLDGSEREILYQGQGTSSGFTGIGLDLPAGRLYWSDEIFEAEKGLWEANLDGSNATRIFASPEGWNAGAMTVVVTDEPCPADLDDSGDVGFGDLLAVLAAWGNEGGPEDLDGSGVVDFGDVLVLLAAWGPCPAGSSA